MPFYAAGRGDGGSFDSGIEAGLQRIIADPQFIYRGEREPAGLAAGRHLPARPISSWRRACRSSCGAASRTIS